MSIRNYVEACNVLEVCSFIAVIIFPVFGLHAAGYYTIEWLYTQSAELPRELVYTLSWSFGAGSTYTLYMLLNSDSVIESYAIRGSAYLETATYPLRGEE